MLNDLMVFAGGFKGNLGGDRIDILNSTDRTWRQAKMSANRTLFAGAALGHTAIFGCGESAGAGTADILDMRTLQVRTVPLAGGARKKCAATSVVLATDAAGNPTEGKIIIGGGYKSVACDVWDLKTDTWTVTNMSESHFYMAATSAGPYSLFCGGLAPSGDTALCDVYDARGVGSWFTGNLSKAVREISAATVGGVGTGLPALAVFLGGGQTTVFNGSASPPTWTYGNRCGALHLLSPTRRVLVCSCARVHSCARVLMCSRPRVCAFALAGELQLASHHSSVPLVHCPHTRHALRTAL
jgi:hypothetical protein